MTVYVYMHAVIILVRTCDAFEWQSRGSFYHLNLSGVYCFPSVAEERHTSCVHFELPSEVEIPTEWYRWPAMISTDKHIDIHQECKLCHSMMEVMCKLFAVLLEQLVIMVCNSHHVTLLPTCVYNQTHPNVTASSSKSRLSKLESKMQYL